MAREDVNIKVSANVAEAIRLWKAMEEGPQAMGRELDALGTKGKKAGGGMAADFEKLVGKWASITAGIEAAKKILDAFIKSQQEALKTTGDASKSTDAMTRELFLLTPGNKSQQQIRTDMLTMSANRGTSAQMTKDVMASLLGAGYSYDQVVGGGGADAVLRTLSATNATGAGIDAKQLTDALTAHLSATGQDRSAANLQAAGLGIQGLFAATKMEMTDLTAWAPRSKNIADISGLKNEIIGIASMFKDVTSADVGATATHTAMVRLAASANNKRSMRALAELGLKPQDVDFQGESFGQVQQLLAQRFEAAGANAPRIKSALFGNEGLIAGNVLFSQAGVQQYRERLAMMNDQAGFDRSANVIEGGLQAKANAAEARSQMAHADEGFVDPETARKEMMTWLKQNEASAAARALAVTAFDETLKWTSDPAAATFAGVRWVGGSRETSQAIVDRARANEVQTVKIELTDQNQVQIPHKKTVKNIENRSPKPKAGR